MIGACQRLPAFEAPIEGELDRKAIRARPHTLQPDDGRWKKLPSASE
jgi:hypothetical protein